MTIETAKSKRKPTITLSADNEAASVEQVIGALAEWASTDTEPERDLYCKGGEIVRVLPSESPSAPKGSIAICQVPKPVVRELIGDAVYLMREGSEITKGNRKGEIGPPRAVSPPDWLVKSVSERRYWGGRLRALDGVVTAPTLRPNGTILQTPGYDRVTGLLYRPNAEYPEVPELPSKQEVQAAIGRLLDVVVDFPFEAEADKSVWLAMVLTMTCRPSVAGCVPLFAVGANIRGAGKSLLVDASSEIAYGHRAARQTFSIEREEQRKLITAIALAAIPAVLFDNLSCKLAGDALDAAITSSVWTDRLLGGNKQLSEPLRTVFTATGNNLQYGGDIARRVLPIRLASPLENPEERQDFRHADLLVYVASNRPRLAVDALTLVRAYFAAGCPEQSGGQFGSFEQWSALIRGAIVWAGLADPLDTREAAKAADDDGEILSLLITALDELDTNGTGLTVKELETANSEGANESLQALIGQTCPKGFNARTVGNLLKKFKARVYRGFKIDGKVGHANLTRWRVVRLSCGESGYLGESISVAAEGKTFFLGSESAERSPAAVGIDYPEYPDYPQGLFDASSDLDGSSDDFFTEPAPVKVVVEKQKPTLLCRCGASVECTDYLGWRHGRCTCGTLCKEKLAQ